jgi:TolB protein
VTMVGQMSHLTRIGRRGAIMALFASLLAGPLSARDATADAPALLIAIPGFFGISPDELEKGRGIASLIASDLRGSGKFTPLDPNKYGGMVIDTDPAPEFNHWRALNVQCLVTGRLSLQPDGRFKVEFRLWDVATAQQIYASQYFVAPDQWHRVPHIIANSIYERLTGQAARFEDKN